MFAIISDIHSNLKPLAILVDIDARASRRSSVLATWSAMGPIPGNALISSLSGLRLSAAITTMPSLRALRNVALNGLLLTAGAEDEPTACDRRWEFCPACLSGGLRGHALRSRLAAKAGQYLFADDVYLTSCVAGQLRRLQQKACFVGHTHVPGVCGRSHFESPDELSETGP